MAAEVLAAGTMIAEVDSSCWGIGTMTDEVEAGTCMMGAEVHVWWVLRYMYVQR